MHPASGATGPATEVGPDVFRQQLWIPAGTVAAGGGSASTEIRGGRLRLGGGLGLEKFFDRVNHDKLMGQIAKRVQDKRLVKLIRAKLNAGGMEKGLEEPSEEGKPQRRR